MWTNCSILDWNAQIIRWLALAVDLLVLRHGILEPTLLPPSVPKEAQVKLVTAHRIGRSVLAELALHAQSLAVLHPVRAVSQTVSHGFA